MQDILKTVMIPVHREGWPFIAIFMAATVLLGWLWTPLVGPGAVLTAWCVYFFRDPDRVTPIQEGLIISPADGVVQSVGQMPPPPELEMGDDARTRISIFMNVFNVHVNRIPVDGTVSRLSYRPGKFVNASLDKASEDNERQAVRVATADGRDIAFVQIAGLIARRILCTLAMDQVVRAGERFGMIRFGSRVDVYLPKGVEPLVCIGQTSIAGETVLADLKSEATASKGEVR
jgi:phosphatidylserine decarboxylase